MDAVVGIEEYGTSLRPVREGACRAPDLCATLGTLGFTPEPPSDDPPAGARFVLDGGDHLVEALVRDQGGFVQRVSLRFAVCQPDAALESLLRSAHALSTAHGLAIHDDYGGGTYGTGDLAGFADLARAKARHLKAKWRELFAGDSEEPKLRVEEAWGHFRLRRAGAPPA